MNNRASSYAETFEQRYAISAEGPLTDFLSRRDGRLLLGDAIDLNAMVARYGAPLEVVYCPQITTQIEQMHAWAAQAAADVGYRGAFVYAYATKANFAEEVVRTALAAGAHYETSAAADVVIAHQLWRQGILPGDRWMFCNGSKDADYRAAMIALRCAGYERLVPVVDDLDELAELIASCPAPLLLGVRERHAPEVVDPQHPGAERFGLTADEMRMAVRMVAGTPHRIVLYHAMVGSQLEDAAAWQRRLTQSLDGLLTLQREAPTLTMFNIGGGMPTSAYRVDFAFDYPAFLTRVFALVAQGCDEAGVAHPALVGEFGRYTVASHSVFLLEVGAVKAGQAAESWYLMNASLMVNMPDMLFVAGQEFVVLPLDDWDAPAAPVRLGGRATCDSDDFYPRPGQSALWLPESTGGLVLAVFGVGAYQQMISGRGGAHHCLTPDMRRIIIERDDDALVVREVPPQSLGRIMEALGYTRETLEPLMPAVPAAEPVERLPRTPRRAQSLFRPRVGGELRNRRARI